jgi:hypothetical protein
MATGKNKGTLDKAPAPAEQVDNKQLAADAFAANPNAEQFFQTSDGQCFARENDAKSHAKRLGDRLVDTVTREEADEEAPKEDE